MPLPLVLWESAVDLSRMGVSTTTAFSPSMAKGPVAPAMPQVVVPAEQQPVKGPEQGALAGLGAGPAAGPAPTEKTPKFDPEKLEARLQEAIEQLNEQLQQSARELTFSIDGPTDRVVVSVFNKETGELVRQIPAEAVVRLAESLENLKGLLFDQET